LFVKYILIVKYIPNKVRHLRFDNKKFKFNLNLPFNLILLFETKMSIHLYIIIDHFKRNSSHSKANNYILDVPHKVVRIITFVDHAGRK